ncbi:GNAT family N-acetyltransferase [Bradyrhizobium sp.]|uniref:GNAT family N-acetyltransferase n=1 Tax=Bradyrhizobium sp. TaxID=376 RepID=UPI0025C13FCC|nr:GNAT family N-acetyltransferase [Bradyrhizobium sp.]
MLIRPFEPSDTLQIVDLSMRAWGPVFEKLRPAVPSYVYQASYPKGWDVRQKADIEKFLAAESDNVFVAAAPGKVAGFVGIRIHPEDQMGEVYILAVDPAHQRYRHSADRICPEQDARSRTCNGDGRDRRRSRARTVEENVQQRRFRALAGSAVLSQALSMKLQRPLQVSFSTELSFDRTQPG